MRVVYNEDAIAWLKANPVLEGCSVVASMPDISEFPSYSLLQWKEWFMETASLALSRTPDNGVTIFFQSDIKVDGAWVDKSFLVQKAAEAAGHELLWHKIVCRNPAGTVTFGRPSYSHVLCFSKGLRPDISKSSPDVLPGTGDKTWTRGMGLEVGLMIARFIKEQIPASKVVSVFCGEGAMLACAEHLGLESIGVERSVKRAEKARTLKLTASGRNWD